MAVIHEVVQGECLSLIAEKYGFADWRTIYNHPDNAEFRSKRPNPNLIYPGDLIVIPDRTAEKEACATEMRHRFQLKEPRLVLRIAIEDREGKRLSDRSYELVVGDRVLNGRTDGDGLLEEPIPVDAETARLTVDHITWELQISHLNPIEEDTPDGGVSGAQGRLFNMGYDVGEINGIWGPKVEAAIKQFQCDYGLQENGILDQATRSKLVDIYGC